MSDDLLYTSMAEQLSLLEADLKRAEDRADIEGWIDTDDLEKELDIVQDLYV